jgi:hypothetical protein
LLRPFPFFAYIAETVNMPPHRWSRPDGLNDEATKKEKSQVRVQKFAAGAVFVGVVTPGMFGARAAQAGPR